MDDRPDPDLVNFGPNPSLAPAYAIMKIAETVIQIREFIKSCQDRFTPSGHHANFRIPANSFEFHRLLALMVLILDGNSEQVAHA